MTLQNDRQLLMAKRKLGALAQLIEQAKRSGGKGSGAELRSLTRLANQLREEIARYEAVASHRS